MHKHQSSLCPPQALTPTGASPPLRARALKQNLLKNKLFGQPVTIPRKGYRIRWVTFSNLPATNMNLPSTSACPSVMDDGSVEEFVPGDVSLIPPGHDAWVVGEEPVVVIDISGMIHYAKNHRCRVISWCCLFFAIKKAAWGPPF